MPDRPGQSPAGPGRAAPRSCAPLPLLPPLLREPSRDALPLLPLLARLPGPPQVLRQRSAIAGSAPAHLNLNLQPFVRGFNVMGLGGSTPARSPCQPGNRLKFEEIGDQQPGPLRPAAGWKCRCGSPCRFGTARWWCRWLARFGVFCFHLGVPSFEGFWLVLLQRHWAGGLGVI